jgi:hypothetical protein
MKRFLIFLLLLPVIAGAANVNLTSGMLPYTAASYDVITISGSYISSATNGILISGRVGVVLNLGTDTLEWGTAAGSSCYGIHILNSHDITINGGTIIRDQGPGQEAGEYNWGVHLESDNYNITCNGTTIITDGFNGKCVWIEPSTSTTKNLVFNHCTFTLNSNSFYGRDSYGGSALHCNSFGASLAADEFHLKICSSRVTIASQIGFMLRGRCLIFDDTINVDAQNVKWDTIYLDRGIEAPVGPSADNCYAILAREVKGGTQIYNNLITSGTNHQGCRGIMIENSIGTAALPINVHDNTLHLHSGPTGENLEGILRGLRIRSMDGILDYVNLYHNTIYATTDTIDGTPAYGQEAVALEVELWYTSSSYYTSHIRVDSNTVYARAMTGGTNTKAVGIYDNPGTDTSLSTFSYNHIYSSNIIMRLASEYYTVGCRIREFKNNTLGFLDTSLAINDSFIRHDTRTWKIGSGTSSEGNVASNDIYVNDALPTDISWSGTGNITHKRTMQIHVVDSAGYPVHYASVWMKNKNGTTSFTTTTDVNGNATGVVTYVYGAYGASTINYNPFSIGAAYLPDTTIHASFTVAGTAAGGVDTLILENTTAGQRPPQISNIQPVGADSGETDSITFTVTDDSGIVNIYLYTFAPDSVPGVNDSIHIWDTTFAAPPTSYNRPASGLSDFQWLDVGEYLMVVRAINRPDGQITTGTQSVTVSAITPPATAVNDNVVGAGVHGSEIWR